MQDTLRNLGVDEELVRLPPAPSAGPDDKPGMRALVETYGERMQVSLRHSVPGWVLLGWLLHLCKDALLLASG